MPPRTIFGIFGASPSTESAPTPSPPAPVLLKRKSRSKTSPLWAYAADLDEEGNPPFGQNAGNLNCRVFRCKACIQKGRRRTEYATQGGSAHFRAHLLKYHNTVVPTSTEGAATDLANEIIQEARERPLITSHQIPPRESSLRQGRVQEGPAQMNGRGQKHERDESDIEEELAIVESKMQVEEIKKRLAELEVGATHTATGMICHFTH